MNLRAVVLLWCRISIFQLVGAFIKSVFHDKILKNRCGSQKYKENDITLYRQFLANTIVKLSLLLLHILVNYLMIGNG